MNELNEFDPVLYSKEENEWLLDNIGLPVVVAMRSIPHGVVASQVRPLLARVNELDELEKHEGQKWVGVSVIKDAIKTYLTQDAKWETDYRRNPRAPRFPSLYSFDSKGRAHRGGPGSDSGRVRTYFDEKGNRIPFAVKFHSDEMPDWVPPGFGNQGTEKVEVGLVLNDALNRIECFCGHTETFKADSRASYSAARARISKHLRKATDRIEQHRELHTAEFGG